MQVPKTLPAIESAVARESSRYTLSCPWMVPVIEGGTGLLCATDGRILAVLPVELTETDEGGAVPIEAIKVARKNATAERTNSRGDVTRRAIPAEVLLNGTAAVRSTEGEHGSFPREDARGPNIDTIIPDRQSSALSICLSAEALFRLAKAITLKDSSAGCGHAIRLQLSGDGKGGIDCYRPIRVDPLEGEGAGYGAIMPISH